MTPTVSIILINWNTRPLLSTCLDSIQKTVPPLSFEIIVVDNNSKDDSISFLQSTYPQIRLIHNDRNYGFAHAVNQGFDAAIGKYILVLNTDITLTDNAVSSLVGFVENTADAGIVGGQLINPDGSNQNSIAPFPSLTTELMNKTILRLLFPRKFGSKRTQYDKPVAVDTLVGAAFLVNRDAVTKVGKMDETFFFYFEETDWCKKLSQFGYRIYFNPFVRIIHQQGRSIATPSLKIRSRIEYYISRYLYFRKYYSRGVQLGLQIGLILKLLVELFSNTLFGLVTGFYSPALRLRLRIIARLLIWHLRGCPLDWGLRELNQ